jgi:dihydroflavonol-4-reductase
LNLVTGATGIIGSHVVLHLLKANKEVIACKRKGSDVNKVKKLFSYYKYGDLFEKIKWKEIDLQDPFSIEEAFQQVEEVYHCAGFVSFLSKDRSKLFQVNEKGTANVVNACIQQKVKALCHVSSIATINNLDYHSILTEEVFWKKSGKESDYAISKYNAEREAWRGVEEGLNVVIVNPGVVLSPGFWDQSSSRLFKVCYEGNSFYTEGKAAYVSATDTAAIMCSLMEKGQFASRYIIAEGNYFFKEVLDQICHSFQKKGPGLKAGKILLEFARVFDGIGSGIRGKEQRITRALINSAFSTQSYSNSKIKEALSINFTPIQTLIPDICSIYLREQGKTSDKQLKNSSL